MAKDKLEYFESVKEHIEEARKAAHEAIDEAKGATVVIALGYDKEGEPDGATMVLNMIGSADDIIEMHETLHKASHSVIEEALEKLEGGAKRDLLMALLLHKLEKEIS